MPHERFRRVDNDLHIVMPITVEDAMCGCTLEIPTLAKHGRPTALPIEPLGTSNKVRCLAKSHARCLAAAAAAAALTLLCSFCLLFFLMVFFFSF
jgi:hypothetical protein